MNLYTLKYSIYCIYALMLFMVLQHITAFFTVPIGISVPIFIMELLFKMLFFLQLRFNLEKYLHIDKIKTFIYLIIIAYVAIYFMGITFACEKSISPNIKNSLGFQVTFFVAGLLGALGIINMFIQYIILGRKFINHIPVQRELKIVGYFYLVIPAVFLLDGFLAVTIKIHLFVIVELLPLFYMIRLYKQLLKSEDDAEASSYIG